MMATGQSPVIEVSWKPEMMRSGVHPVASASHPCERFVVELQATCINARWLRQAGVYFGYLLPRTYKVIDRSSRWW
jgi:hypothetical protein